MEKKKLSYIIMCLSGWYTALSVNALYLLEVKSIVIDIMRAYLAFYFFFKKI
jgi:hypothetical protein